MMLTKCYCVVYHVADFAADNEIIYHQDAYRDHNNALLVAKDLAKCFDVVDDVYVIDGLTGEVLNTILKDAPQEDVTKEDDAPTNETEKEHSTPVDTYKDKNGDTWYSGGNGKWKFDCTNRHCSDCPYYDEEHGCIVEEPLHEVDRNYQVALAYEKMRAKAKETKRDSTPASDAKEEENSTPSGIFDDGTGGVWRLTEGNKWDYDCTSLTCSNCAYYNESHCVVRDFLTEKERNIQIKAAKARMKK